MKRLIVFFLLLATVGLHSSADGADVPASGQPILWGCSVAGTFGTDSPPTWVAGPNYP